MQSCTFVSEMGNTSGERKRRKNLTLVSYSTNKTSEAVKLSKTVSAVSALTGDAVRAN